MITFESLLTTLVASIILEQRCPTYLPLATCGEWSFIYGEWPQSKHLKIRLFGQSNSNWWYFYLICTLNIKKILKWMALDVKFVKKLVHIRQKRYSFAISQKCGKWPNLFATIVANRELLLDIAVLDQGWAKYGPRAKYGQQIVPRSSFCKLGSHI